MSSYVSQIQTKLKACGYYHGDIDGIVGEKTLLGVTLAMKGGVCTVQEGVDINVINKTDPLVTDADFKMPDIELPNASMTVQVDKYHGLRILASHGTWS